MDIDFSAANLEGASFGGTYFVNANFSGTNLERSHLCTRFINSDLSHANLRGAKFTASELTGTKLTRADLTGADLTGATLRSTKLIGCNLRDADLTNIKVGERTIFASTIMPDGSMRRDSPKVVNAQELLKRYADGERDFRDIILHRVNLSGVNLRSVNLCGAYFSHVNLQGAILEGEDVSAKFICCDMRDSQLICASPDYGNHPHFCCCDLRWSTMRGGIKTFSAISNNFQGSNVSFCCDDGDVFIQNTTWPNGEFIAGPTWLMEHWRDPRDINF
ncbi:pentapeptide repeat-containing protein [Cronbergia sp. UHCC 0137]|uniref:pentapeptide repeat-containing protein n=1 Tax=Cronbergia sp. UHCC 0137 TaxID=3110239 RepID=UPI003A4C6B6A